MRDAHLRLCRVGHPEDDVAVMRLLQVGACKLGARSALTRPLQVIRRFMLLPLKLHLHMVSTAQHSYLMPTHGHL